MNRRQFVKTSAGVVALLAARGRAYAYANSAGFNLLKFNGALPIFGVDIPIAVPDKLKYPGVDYYEIEMGAFRHPLHSGLPVGGQRLYGYADVTGGKPALYRPLGGAIVATKGRPVRIKFTNKLPASHIIPFDQSIPMPSTGLRQDRAAVHLHGGLVPWASDGGPFHWFANPNNAGGGAVGASVVSWLPGTGGALTDEYYYPNNQSARFMWYHDHAIGITRTSAYAGLATGYLVIDPAVESRPGMPGPANVPDIPMVFQDKVFWDQAVDPNYALYAPGAAQGDLWYPYLYEKAIWKMQGNAKAAPIPSAIPEMFGDTMLVNGKAYPIQSVSLGAYRFRMLNACNARFLNLSFVLENGSTGEPLLNAAGLPVVAPVNVGQIGNEGGYLPSPVKLFTNGLANFLNPLLLGPAERADLIVDFSAVGANTNVILYNDAPAPYPFGAPIFDFYLGAPKNPVQPLAGHGPNTRTIMRFSVGATTGVSYTPPLNLGQLAGVKVLPTMPDPNRPGALTLNLGQIAGDSYFRQFTINPTPRQLTLNEAFDQFGRLMQLVGTTVPTVKGTFGRAYLEAPTENLSYGTIEIWNIYNLTADAHPMHTHLFNAMILARQLFRVQSFNGVPVFTGPARGPDPTETGWKETFKAYPGECLTLAVLVEGPLATVDAAGVVFHKNRAITVTAAAGAPVNVTAAAGTTSVVVTTDVLSGLATGNSAYAHGIGIVADGVYTVGAVASVAPPYTVELLTPATGTFTLGGKLEKTASYSASLPYSPRLATFVDPLTGLPYGLAADEYVWHCHILEHEEHDMMRPLTAL